MSEVPLYKVVRKQILERLARGEWKPGDCLPSEPELAKRFGVSISTIRAALAELDSGRILVRRQGKGTFVAAHDLHTERYQLSSIYDRAGTKIFPSRDVISVEKSRADKSTIRQLQLEGRDSVSVFNIKAMLKCASDAVGYMHLILPVWLFPRFRASDLRSDENLYTIFQRVHGVTVLRMEETVSAAVADAPVAKHLGIKRNAPILRVDRISYSFNSVPVELRQRSFDGTRHQYSYKQEHVE